MTAPRHTIEGVTETCWRCAAAMEWRHGTWQCPRCRFKLGCCEGEPQSPECRTEFVAQSHKPLRRTEAS